MLRIENLGKSYGDKILLSGVKYQFGDHDRVALVGENGAGKSTLLNILCGFEAPDEGGILRPSGTILGFLPQEPNPDPKPSVLEECLSGHNVLYKLLKRLEELTAALGTEGSDVHEYEDVMQQFTRLDGHSLSGRAERILRGLGFLQKQFQQDPKQLSGGWRMRLELGKIFVQSPDFLILDEPTNHLDLPSLMWVEDYLKQFRGSLLFVSHDRSLVNRLASTVLHLHRGELRSYTGNYDRFLERRAKDAEAVQSARKNLLGRRAELQDFVDRLGAKASKASQAQSKRKMIDALDEDLDKLKDQAGETRINLNWGSFPTPGRIICRIDNGSIGYDSDLCSEISLEVEKGQKIAVIGANGIGKSTMLKTLIGRLPSRTGNWHINERTKVAYFAQDQLDYLDGEKSVLDNILDLCPLGQSAARDVLGGFGFSGKDVNKKLKVLSGGEKSRVGLACLVAQGANFLILDEPTNHLDMASIESLADSLAKYQGTMLFVSHDRGFIDGLCTHVFAMDGAGRSMLFSGKLDDYQRLAAIANFRNVLQIAEDTKIGGDVSSPGHFGNRKQDVDFRAEKKRLSALRRELSDVEGKLEKARVQLASTDRELATLRAEDYLGFASLDAKRREAAKVIDTLEARWLELSETLEA